MGLFDDFPKFLATSKTGASAVRLNARHRAIIETNAALINGRRILDIASHDGRWSFAALKAGAERVTGIEAREGLTTAANATFAHYGIGPDRFEFIRGDVFDVMRDRTFLAETVLLLGFYYHTERHGELAAMLSKTGASHIILDGSITPAAENPHRLPFVKLRSESTTAEGYAFGHDPFAIVGHPTREAIDLVFSRHGFKMTEFDWSPLRGPTELADYNEGRRSTFVLSR